MAESISVKLNIESALRSVGKWYYLKTFEIIYGWRSSKSGLVERLCDEFPEKNYNGTSRSVSEALRIRDAGASGKALEILLESERFMNEHPEAHDIILEITTRHPEVKTRHD